jgi:hypothetical protein
VMTIKRFPVFMKDNPWRSSHFSWRRYCHPLSCTPFGCSWGVIMRGWTDSLDFIHIQYFINSGLFIIFPPPESQRFGRIFQN